jgi:hypothetical protein
MAKAVIGVLLVDAVLVGALGVALAAGVMPLGVRGEWEWSKIPANIPTSWPDVGIAFTAVLVFAAFAGIGRRYLVEGCTRGREWLMVALLLFAAIGVQAIVPSGAPVPFGLSKWPLALYQSGTSGYFTIARQQIRDPWRFVAEYPTWIREQDSLHVGTHPPGLFVFEHVLCRQSWLNPWIVRNVMAHVPSTVDEACRAIDEHHPLARPDRAALALTGALTLLACAATVVPLYVLTRSSGSAADAWSAAALWPLVPSAILFQPAADTAFAFASTTALGFGVAAATRERTFGGMLAVCAGVVLAFGMLFSLVFAPIGLMVGLVLAARMDIRGRRRLLLITSVGLGFLVPILAVWALTGGNPFEIWWWNARNHARFYVEFPRSYWTWVGVNAIELAIALGLPASLWALIGLIDVRSAPRVFLATAATLVGLTLTGRNLSEVARLWLPMMPALLVGAAWGIRRLGGGPMTLALSVAIVGIETLFLEAIIQVVYPV